MSFVLSHIPALILLLAGIAIGMVLTIFWMGWRTDKPWATKDDADNELYSDYHKVVWWDSQGRRCTTWVTNKEMERLCIDSLWGRQ